MSQNIWDNGKCLHAGLNYHSYYLYQISLLLVYPDIGYCEAYLWMEDTAKHI